MNTEIIAAIITGICSLIGAIIGGCISSKLTITKLKNVKIEDDRSIHFNDNYGISAGGNIKAGGSIINEKYSK